MTAPTLQPRPPHPRPAPPVAREYARTKATRLLSAGAYLDPVFRRNVVRELLKNRWRVVAPSYGYDAVSVLAHALAARRLRRIQLGLIAASAVFLLILLLTGVLGPLLTLLLFVWAWWVTAYLRRVVTLQTLITRLKENGPDGGFDGAYPVTPDLTDALVRKVDNEQSTRGGLVFYGGFVPFVGAGVSIHDWSNAQLLLGAPKSRIIPRDLAGTDGEPDVVERKAVKPFDVHDITAYVAARMAGELRDDARPDERIEGLTVERRRYTTAVRTNDRALGTGWSRLPGMGDLPDVHWREDYDSAREYLCLRVGSWNEELVTSMFVGFDLKGDTLHTEFYTYVLGPLVKDFHLVDQLPDTFDGPLALRVAWNMIVPSWLQELITAPLRLLSERSSPQPRHSRMIRLKGSAVTRTPHDPVRADSSELQLGRYVTDTADCGPLMSVREMATNATYHHFFQKSDAVKYTQIVERRLLQAVRDFLQEHNVDLTDHDRAQTNVLNFGDKSQNVFGNNNSKFSYNNESAAGGSSNG